LLDRSNSNGLCSHCQGAELQRRNQNLTAALAEAEQRIEQLRAASASSNADELQRELRKREKRLQLATSEVARVAPSRLARPHSNASRPPVAFGQVSRLGAEGETLRRQLDDAYRLLGRQSLKPDAAPRHASPARKASPPRSAAETQSGSTEKPGGTSPSYFRTRGSIPTGGSYAIPQPFIPATRPSPPPKAEVAPAAPEPVPVPEEPEKEAPVEWHSEAEITFAERIVFDDLYRKAKPDEVYAQASRGRVVRAHASARARGSGSARICWCD
jgi:hypothetical protein